jgi:DNA topoisomerase III
MIFMPGTDATIAQHIQTIIDRDYVLESMEGNTKYLVPTKLGIGLIEGYNQIGLEKSLSKPFLRREVSFLDVLLHSFHRIILQTEKCMVQVCEGTKSKNDMIDHSIVQYKEMFITARREFDKVISVRQPHLLILQ